MKKCPFCAEDIQDAAIVCKHCQRDLPSPPARPAVVVRSERDLPNGQKVFLGGFAVVLLIWFILSYPTEQSYPVTSTTPTKTDTSSVEHKMAELDCRCVISDNDSTMLRFRYLLDDLSKATGETPQQLGDETAKAQQLAKGYGKDMTLLDLMESSRQLMTMVGGTPDYRRAVASIVTQRVK